MVGQLQLTLQVPPTLANQHGRAVVRKVVCMRRRTLPAYLLPLNRFVYHPTYIRQHSGWFDSATSTSITNSFSLRFDVVKAKALDIQLQTLTGSCVLHHQ